LATPKLLVPVVKGLGKLATLHMVEGADHSFKVLKSSGRSEADVILELAETAARWIGRHF
jgi:predicted alpha/beta-hydrolase family hydrolase